MYGCLCNKYPACAVGLPVRALVASVLGRLTVSHELEAPNQICGAKLHVLALHLCINLGSMHEGRKLVVFVRNEVEVRKLRFSDC